MAGSSPPARGTRLDQLFEVVPGRFIPACAGNTRSDPSPPSTPPVHPRLRGEHSGSVSRCCSVAGSSPPARGTRPRPSRRSAAVGFIPACAGNTRRSPTMAAASPVHPRLRGEHGPALADNGRAAGSSPPARGTPFKGDRQVAAMRFIPACAGNTLRWQARWRGLPVHPRLRGEHC